MPNGKVLVVIGASGYLAKSKIFPALWDLYQEFSMLPPNFQVICYARSKLSIRDIKERSAGFMSGIGTQKGQDEAERFWRHAKYVCGDYKDIDKAEGLTKALQEMEDRFGHTDRVFYLAVPFEVQKDIATLIKTHWMAPNGYTKIAVELPVAHNMEGFNELEAHMANLFKPEQIYRVNHDLSENLVSSVLALRFGNSLFPALWNKDTISSVMLTYKEREGGFLREAVLHSMLNILSLIGMEQPKTNSFQDIKAAKLEFLKEIKPLNLENVVIGKINENQAQAAQNGAGNNNSENSIFKDSKISFVTMVLQVENHRWEGVPLILRYGHSVDESKYEARIQFKGPHDKAPNEVVYQLQPCERMLLRLSLIEPNLHGNADKNEIDLSYGSKYTSSQKVNVYPRIIQSLLNDAEGVGKLTHFASREELEKGWEILTPLMTQAIPAQEAKHFQVAGTGPVEADQLCNKHGFLLSAYPW